MGHDPDGSGGLFVRRLIIPLLLMAALAPLRAHAATVSGSVILPSFGTPAIARLGALVDDEERLQGIAGYVFSLPAKCNPSCPQFTLRRTGGMTGMEDFDLFFYESLEGPTGTTAGSAMCTTSNPVCQGTVPLRANYAIVTLSLGFAGTFTYSNP